MNKINPVVLENMKSSSIGRLKLKLFKEMTGRENYSPSSQQRKQFASKIKKGELLWLEITAYILTDARYAVVNAEQLAEEIDIDQLFSHLNANPLSKPMFFEISGWFENEAITGVWVNCCELQGHKGHFYALAFLKDDDTPIKISYFEIRTSQIEPEPAFCFYNSAGEQVSLGKYDPEINENASLGLCLQVLNCLSKTHVEPFIPFEKSLESNNKHKFKAGDRGPDDPLYKLLVQKVARGEIYCHMGLTDIEKVIPLSFNACFNIPLNELLEAKKHLEDYISNGLVVYWKEGHFIMSDDYLPYMIFRICGIKEIKVIVLGEDGKDQMKILATGGTNLFPGIQIAQAVDQDSLALNLRKLHLDDHIIKLAATVNLKTLLSCKCVVISEDSKTEPLEILLQANGFNTDETTIMSYDNCTKIDLLPLTLETSRKINNNLVFIIHRDRDYLSEEKATKILDQINALGAIPFLTDGTDIESHFLNPDHFCYLSNELDKAEANAYLNEARLKTRDFSITKMLKEKHGERYKNHLDELTEYTIRYDALPERYSSGKETMRALKSLVHPKLGKLNLFQESNYLTNEVLNEVAGALWPY